MGLSSLTRYALFMESGDFIANGNEILLFRNPIIVSDMYYDSARLIRGFEDLVNSGNESLSRDEYQSIFENNAEDVQNKMVVQRITELVRIQTDERKRTDIPIAIQDIFPKSN